MIHDERPNHEFSRLDKVWLQTWIHANADLIDREGTFPFLNAAKREIAQLGQLRIEDVFRSTASWWSGQSQTIPTPGSPTG